jgi:hypothetical protein
MAHLLLQTSSFIRMETLKLVSKRLVFLISVLIKCIAGLENCYTRTYNSAPTYQKALSSLVPELMNGYIKEDGAVGVDNLDRWPPESNAVAFLSETTSATSIFDLIEVSTLEVR